MRDVRSLLLLVALACGSCGSRPETAPARLYPVEQLRGWFLTFSFVDDRPRTPGTPVAASDALYAAFQARMDQEAAQLSLKGRPLSDVLASDPEVARLWREARDRPLFSMVTPLPDGRQTVMVQCDLKGLAEGTR